MNEKVSTLKKEFIRTKKRLDLHLDIEGAYDTLNRMAEWGCLINYGLNAFSQKVNDIQISLNNLIPIEKFNLLEHNLVIFERAY